MYKYDRRIVTGSLTPLMDRLVKDAGKIMSVAGTAVNVAHKVADQVEDLALTNPNDERIKGLCRKAVDAAYNLFESFRSFLNGGDAEIKSVEDFPVTVVREARNLYNVLRFELSPAYNLAVEASSKSGVDAMTATHELAVACATVRSAFGQYLAAYK